MRLRILHVLEAVQFGTVRHLRDVVRHVDAEHLLAIPPAGSGRYTDVAAIESMRTDGARIRFVAMRRSPVDLHNAAAITRVRGMIRRSRVHVVHGHSSIGGAVARVASIGTGAATVYTPHGVFPSRATLALERVLGTLTDRFIALSNSEAELVATRRLVAHDRIVVIPNGVEMDVPASIDLRGRLGIPANAFLVGNVGRLAAQKAPEVFVRACARVATALPDPHFVLIGDGELAPLVDREVAASGIEGRFHSVRMPSGGEAAMSELDVFVMSSRYEGAAYAPLEAMRAGVPVVLTDVVGNRDAVEARVSGLLVPPDDPAALAGAIRELIDHPRLRAAIGENGRQRVAERYDIRRLADELAHVYESLVTGG